MKKPKFPLKTRNGDMTFWLEDIEKNEPKPDSTNAGPFDMFIMIDGHRGSAIAEYLKKHVMEVIFRNRNIMIRKRYSKGLK
jgi:serine/threonine protein phosphatase PrpC